ncbi:MAG: hypothetical protein RBR71_05040 [Gudongella sp.]|nr:hypothetical protein [Gudongella sp.]
MGQYDNFIQSVRALPGYYIEVIMQTGAVIHYNFISQLCIPRFNALQEEKVFQSVRTDGDYLLFSRDNLDCTRITAKEFMDMLMVNTSQK